MTDDMKNLKVSLLLLLTVFMIQNLSAQHYIIPLWSGEIPNSQKSGDVEMIDNSAGLMGYHLVQNPDIKVFLPTKRNSTGQALIICPGGGYQGLAYDWEGLDYAKYLNTIGVAGIVLKYRLPVSKSNVIPYKSPLMDVQRAIRITRFNAAKWNIDPKKIGVMGSSAGGHLASTAGTHFDYGNTEVKDSIERMSCRPDFMVLMYPVITFTEPYTHKGSRDNLLGKNADPKLVTEFSNELQVRDDTPPAFIVHGDDDTGVPVENSLMFYTALRKHKISAELHIYSEGGHGFGLAVNKGHHEFWPQACHEWLKWLNTQYKK
jgi:acetyl esterase/lipase